MAQLEASSCISNLSLPKFRFHVSILSLVESKCSALTGMQNSDPAEVKALLTAMLLLNLVQPGYYYLRMRHNACTVQKGIVDQLVCILCFVDMQTSCDTSHPGRLSTSSTSYRS